MAIHLVQLLCPKRHCIFALCYPTEEFSDEQAVAMVNTMLNEMVDAKEINPWCGLCGSRELAPEAGVTKFKTMQEAMPHVKTEEVMQMLTRLRFLTDPKRN